MKIETVFRWAILLTLQITSSVQVGIGRPVQRRTTRQSANMRQAYWAYISQINSFMKSFQTVETILPAAVMDMEPSTGTRETGITGVGCVQLIENVSAREKESR